MKTILPLFFAILYGLSNQTLAQRLSPDVELVSEIITQKQEELKQRVLQNIVVSNIRTTNYTTYNSVYNLVKIITTEKNKTVMTQKLLGEIIDYTVVMGVAQGFNKAYLAHYKFTKISEPIVSKERLLTQQPSVQDLYSLIANKTLSKKKVKKGMDTEDTQFEEGKDDIDKKNADSKIKNYSNSKKTTTSREINDIKEDLILLDYFFIEGSRIQKNIYANFIIDSLSAKLRRNKKLQARGIFPKEIDHSRFSTGLEIKYDSIARSTPWLSSLDAAMDKYILDLTENKLNDETSKLVNNPETSDLSQLKLLQQASIQNIKSLYSMTLEHFRNEVGQNNFIAKIGDIVLKYIILDINEEDKNNIYHFSIDVEAIILSMEEKFYDAKISSLKNNLIGVKPFFTMGINYGIFTNSNNDIPNNKDLNSIYQLAYVSEKLGLKFIFQDHKYKNSHKPMEWYPYKGKFYRWLHPVKEPLISRYYAIVYGSGIIYNIVNAKSEKNYDFVMAGIGFGLAFFNDLEVNLTYNLPYIKGSNSFNNGMLNLGFDIPIFDYLKAVKKKKG